MIRSSGVQNQFNTNSLGVRHSELQIRKQSESIRKSFERAIEPILSNKSQRDTIKLLTRQNKGGESKHTTHKSTKKNEANSSILEGKKSSYFNVQCKQSQPF